MKGSFYAVGVGPGDPELITVKAINTIKKCQVVALPKSGASENVALKITEPYLEGKELLYCDMPMIKDETELRRHHNKSADDIAAYLDKGEDVAFLTIGDPAIYSTVMYVHRILDERGYETVMIPGVPSFCGAAASLNTSLCERDQMLHVIPATYKGHMEGQLQGTRILMKSGRKIMEIKDSLEEKKAMMVECATMEKEKVYKDLKDLKEPSSYFSLIVIPAEEGSK